MEVFFNLFAGIGNVRDFLELGGVMMWFIMALGFVMWFLILERIYYFNFGGANKDKTQIEIMWNRVGANDYKQKQLNFLRQLWLSTLQMKLSTHLSLIKTLIAILPLLGLLGTVTGMIEVFDVLTLTNTSNVRAFASGVSKAILPTMASMGLAISGIYFNSLLEKQAAKIQMQYNNLLRQK